MKNRSQTKSVLWLIEHVRATKPNQFDIFLEELWTNYKCRENPPEDFWVSAKFAEKWTTQ